MRDVAGGDVSEGTDGNSVVAGDAVTQPGIGGKVAEESERRRANGAKFFHVTCPRNLVRSGGLKTDFLIEAWQRILKAASKPEGAKHENTLGVVDVSKQLAHGPFARCV